MTEPMTGPGQLPDIPDITEDLWLGGRLTLSQPAKSYRVAIDAALLAAAMPLAPGGRALELGTGVGAAALALAARIPGAAVDGVELQPELAALASRNADANALADRVTLRQGDALALGPTYRGYDEVFFNPPYLKAAENDATADRIKRTATVEGPGGLAAWLLAAARAARPGGGVTLIHRADRLADILAAAGAANVGGLTVFPLWPRPGVAARRVIVRGRAGKGGRMTLAPGLTLHEPDGAYTERAARILAGAEALQI